MTFSSKHVHVDRQYCKRYISDNGYVAIAFKLKRDTQRVEKIYVSFMSLLN